MNRWMLRVALVVALPVTACFSFSALESFKHPESGGIKRAAFELACPQDQIQVNDLGGNTIGVTGCGKRAIYKLVYGVGWVNNSGGEDAKPETPGGTKE